MQHPVFICVCVPFVHCVRAFPQKSAANAVTCHQCFILWYDSLVRECAHPTSTPSASLAAAASSLLCKSRTAPRNAVCGFQCAYGCASAGSHYWNFKCAQPLCLAGRSPPGRDTSVQQHCALWTTKRPIYDQPNANCTTAECTHLNGCWWYIMVTLTKMPIFNNFSLGAAG